MSNELNVALKVLDGRLGSEFPLPAYESEHAAGVDLRAMVDEQITIAPGAQVMVSAGFAIDLGGAPAMAMLLPRSGKGNQGLVLGNTVGVIDADYQGPLKMVLWNRSALPIDVLPGERVAQLILTPILRAKWEVVTDFETASARGEGGFGSSGHH